MGQFINGLPTHRQISYQSNSRTIKAQLDAEVKRPDDSLCNFSLKATAQLPFGKKYSYQLSSNWKDIDGRDRLLNYKRTDQKGVVEEIVLNRKLETYQKIKDGHVIDFENPDIDESYDPLSLMFSLQNNGDDSRFIDRSAKILSFRSIGDIQLNFGEERRFFHPYRKSDFSSKKLSIEIKGKLLKDFEIWIDTDLGIVSEFAYQVPIIGRVSMQAQKVNP